MTSTSTKLSAPGIQRLGKPEAWSRFTYLGGSERELGVDDDHPLPLAFIGNGGNGGSDFAGLAFTEDIEEHFFDLSMRHHLAADF